MNLSLYMEKKLQIVFVRSFGSIDRSFFIICTYSQKKIEITKTHSLFIYTCIIIWKLLAYLDNIKRSCWILYEKKCVAPKDWKAYSLCAFTRCYLLKTRFEKKNILFRFSFIIFFLVVFVFWLLLFLLLLLCCFQPFWFFILWSE